MTRSLLTTLRNYICSHVRVYASLTMACLLFAENVYAKSEQDVKAAYLYNFIKFIDWPEDANSGTHNLCLLGKDTINGKLQKLHERHVKGKTLNVITLSSYEAIKDKDCRILFIGRSEEKFLDDIFTQSPNSPTLTISSIDDFADEGGVIGFIKLGNVIRFNINLKQANNSDLSIRAKLLELANKVVN